MASPQDRLVLRWFEDETFYSLCCRQHVFLSGLSTASTLDWIYGANAHAIKHDFPGNLDSLSQSARSTWGSPESIIFQHTILPLFSPFQSAERIHEAVLAMRSSHIGPLKYRLGLLTGRFGAEHPLKACLSCMEEDRVLHGVAFWHLAHQYPGVILCPAHGVKLAQASVNRQFMGRFCWALPNENILQLDAQILPPSTLKSLLSFGAAVLDLAACGGVKNFKPEIVRLAYREALRQLGSSAQERAAAAASFSIYCSQIQPFPPLGALPITQQAAESFLSRITYRPRGCWHPLKHLVLITWLFGRLELFIEAYDRLENFPSKNACQLQKVATLEPRRPHNLTTLEPTTRKPKKLKSKMRAEVLESLRSGDSKDQICSSFGISICTVNRLLKLEPAIEKSRRELLQKSILLANRSAWLKLIKDHPEHAPKKIRSLSPKTYAWLYRNDREWLLLKSKTMPSGLTGNNSNVNWTKRDKELSKLLSNALINFEHTYEIGKFSKALLVRIVPELVRAFDYPRNYPITNNIVSNLISKNSSINTKNTALNLAFAG